MQKRAHSLILIFIVTICPCLCFAESIIVAGTAYSFRDDFDSIDKKAKSVFLVGNYKKDFELVSTGSEFVCFDEHLFVTNQHVIDEADTLAIMDDNENIFYLEHVIVSDKVKDIAILDFPEGERYESLEIDINEELKRGQPVVTIGSPEGFQNTVAFGNISAFLKTDNMTMIQITAPISHGSSGGCLFDDKGKVIGVTSAGVDEGQNLGFAIPIKIVKELYDQWDKKSYVKLGTKQSWDTVGTTSAQNPIPMPTLTPMPSSPRPISSTGTTVSALTTYEYFEEAAFVAEIPEDIMYVTMDSPEDAPLYTLLAQVGYSYDSFRQFMSENKVVAYGLFLTDYETEFQMAADYIPVQIDLTNATEAEMNVYLTMSAAELEGMNATITKSGIYKGKHYSGFWFHYTIEANGSIQGVIQYTIFHSDRAVNIRGYNYNISYPEEAEVLIQQIFDSIIVD